MVEQASMYSWPQCTDWVRDSFIITDQAGTAALHTSDPHGGADHATQRGQPSVPDERLPPFIDQQRCRILIPPAVFRPKDLNVYIERVGRDPQNAGQGDAILQVLEREPDQIIDALRGSDAKWGMQTFAALLTVLYVLVMWFVGEALGYSLRPGTALGEWLASRFAAH